MTFVLDASAAVAGHFDDERSDAVKQIFELFRDDEAVVPALWYYEVPNSMATGIRRGRTTVEDAQSYLAGLAALPITMMLPSQTSILALAESEGISAYDAAYLDLAGALSIPLATLDRRLRDAAARRGIRLLPERLAG